MGYREDGNFGINRANESVSNGGIENPPFIYPSRSIRFLEAEHALASRAWNAKQAVAGGNYTLHRGYIRNLDQPALSTGLMTGVPISKCKFQFNPQDIQQNVAMREDMYLSILQTPEQLSQPVGSVMNFQFDLLFDRSAEVAAGDTRRGTAGDVPFADQTADVSGDYSPTDVYDIGVMADLRVLYSVIGQGFSKEMLDFQLQNLKINANTVYNSQTPEPSPDQESEDDSGTSTDDAGLKIIDANAEEIMKANFGNSSFLMPNPVRVMFSSLFMLDGFITASKVEFLKFNTNMVPLQCKVYLSMSAMYIGFAQQDTFLTRQFKSAAEAKIQENADKEAAKQELLKALNTTGSSFTAVFTAEGITAKEDIDDAFSNNIDDNNAWTYVVNDASGRRNNFYGRALFMGFDKVRAVRGGEDVYDQETGEQTRTGADDDDILKLFESDAGITISYTTSLSMYGKKSGTSGLSQSEATALLNSGTYKESSSGVVLMGSFSKSETATSKSDWGAGTSGSGADAARVRRRSIHATDGNTDLQNTASNKYNASSSSDVPSSIKNSYYIFEVSVTVTATTNSGVTITSSGTKKGVVQGTQSIGAQRFVLSWAGQNNNPEGPR